MLAETTGGAYFPLNPHIERVTERLPGLLEAVTHFTLGGMLLWKRAATRRPVCYSNR